MTSLRPPVDDFQFHEAERTRPRPLSKATSNRKFELEDWLDDIAYSLACPNATHGRFRRVQLSKLTKKWCLKLTDMARSL